MPLDISSLQMNYSFQGVNERTRTNENNISSLQENYSFQRITTRTRTEDIYPQVDELKGQISSAVFRRIS